MFPEAGSEPLSHKKALFVLVPLVLIVAAIALYFAMPKRYSLGERLAQTSIFWTDKEAFFFLNVNTVGQTDNFISDKLGETRYGYWMFFLGAGPRFMDTKTVACRLLPSGELQQLPLPAEAASYGNWTLEDGNLKLAPASTGYNDRNGFRWDGTRFVSVPPERISQEKSDSTLSSDDEAEDSDPMGFLSPATRKAFKAAGWHYKLLTGFETKGTQATLPIQLGKNTFDLTITKLPKPQPGEARFDPIAAGIKSLEISASGQQQATRVLWNPGGWRQVSKREFEEEVRRSGRAVTLPYTFWIWVPIFILLMVWKLSGWGYLILNVFGVKRRVLKRMPTSFSFPPATPAQFPNLDTAELERYTREFESLGFVRLLDFSLVSDGASQAPSFCRLFAHTRNHCFGEVSQFFPRGKAALALKCSIQSCLQDGWTLGFSDRKPQATSSLLRRKKAIGVCMPNSSPYELLQAFLQMREQICADLGISYLKDDSLEAYIAKMQQAVTDMREAVQQKNFATGISQVYYRKFSLLKTKSEYVWLGDYPKEAERRKQGFPAPVRAS
jgi:hypothetical protein